ncbi:hypothetical protein FQZ97_898640 [compost metagenome]
MKTSQTLSAIAMALILAGCASDPIRNYSMNEEDASLSMRSSGGVTVQYSLSSEAGTCGGFEYVGLVSESTYGLPSSWLSSMPERIRMQAREARISINTELRIKGYARADRGDASCGPLVASFQPEARKAYAVEFKWLDKGCGMVVREVTDADNPKPVPAKLRVCPNPASAASLFLSKDGHVAR